MRGTFRGGYTGHIRILQGSGFPKTRDTFWGVTIIRIIVFWSLHWGPPILGNYHLKDLKHLHGRTQGLYLASYKLLTSRK